MRPLIALAAALSLIGLAFWAYRENYATQGVLLDMAALQAEIAHLTESLSVQRAEWAYLNRPERLRDLVALNFERLPLLPLAPGQFRAVGDVALPPPPLPALPGLDPVDVTGMLPETEEPL
jgi:hypothetical protein